MVVSNKFDIVIVGGGHAGASAAIALRQLGYEGTIAIVGAEPDFPYERPQLSKEYFSGEKSLERIHIRPEQFWVDRCISLIRSTTVKVVDPLAHTVETDANETIHYGQMIWAAGGSARSLSIPGLELAGVQTLRTRADADSMQAAARRARQIVIIGGGFIGLEAAAVLAKLGKSVVVLEAMDRVLARVAAEPISRFLENEHRVHGVDIRTGVHVDALIGSEYVTGVRLKGGETVPADLVIVGVGIDPTIEPLIVAGAIRGNGVSVDEYCRTSLTDIFAVGDCALHRNKFAGGEEIRLESVQNANDMALTAAKTICGLPQPYEALPWFWSNQYDLRLQTVGLSLGHDDSVIRGDPNTRSFSVVYLRKGYVIALDCVNATKDYVQGKAIILADVRPSRGSLEDTSVALKSLT